MPKGDSTWVTPQPCRRNLARQSVDEASKAENLHSQDQNAPLFNCFEAFDQLLKSLIAGWLALRL